MTEMSSRSAALASEWNSLQQHYYRYEQQAVLIKLVAVGLAMLGLHWQYAWLVVAVTLLLWLQEAMLRTWQARLAERSLKLEAALRSPDSDIPACQLHSDWHATRPGSIGLLRSYLLSALRPTVVLPYAVLLLIAGYLLM